MMSLSLPHLVPPVSCPCKICGGDSFLYGAIDFNKYCSDQGGLQIPPANLLIAYNRCLSCSFVFTTAFDNWSPDDFLAHIYNEDYGTIDPDYAERRPTANLTWMETLFGKDKRTLRFLDYGGGNGMLSTLMQRDEFVYSETYDPLVLKFSIPPVGLFNVVSCFETLEHLPDPLKTIGEMCSMVASQGLILFSTLLQPDNFNEIGLFWPYVAPRNGHISIYSKVALVRAFAKFGFNVAGFDNDKHIAYREVPAFAEALFAHMRTEQPTTAYRT